MATSSITRGDSETITGQVFQSPGGAIRDITNDTMKFTAKYSEEDANFIVQKTTVSGITKTNAAQGLYSIAIAPADFAGVTFPTDVICDIELTDNAGRVTTLVKFPLTVILDITI